MRHITADTNLIARCGLFCGACKRYLKERCPGCEKNEKATWCGIRKCCAENSYASCADCKKFDDVIKCPDFNNFMSKLFGFIFRSDRRACVDYIKTHGAKSYAAMMAQDGLQSIKR